MAEVVCNMYIHSPRGAVLCWRIIPAETSGRCLRESDWMLLGSANTVQLYVGWLLWQSEARLLANSPSQLMHLQPNAGTTTKPDARISMNCWLESWPINSNAPARMSQVKSLIFRSQRQGNRRNHKMTTLICGMLCIHGNILFFNLVDSCWHEE